MERLVGNLLGLDDRALAENPVGQVAVQALAVLGQSPLGIGELDAGLVGTLGSLSPAARAPPMPALLIEAVGGAGAVLAVGTAGVGIEVLTHIADHYRPLDLGVVTGIFGRPSVIRDADYLLVVGGGAGTQDEVDLAISAGKKLLPLPASGGTARRAFALMQRDPRLRSWMPDQEFNALRAADAVEFTRIVERTLSAALEQRMSDRPYVLLSCAMSMDGYIDDATDERLLRGRRACWV